MGKVCSFVSIKGGTGKTTTTVNTSLTLAKEGFNVLLIDANLEGSNVSFHLGMMTNNISTVHDYLNGKCDLNQAIYTLPSGLNIMLGGSRLDDLNVQNDDFRRLITLVKDKYDFIIVDCCSGLGNSVRSVLDNSNEVVIVTNPELPAVVDAFKVVNYCEQNGYFIKGVVVNKDKKKNDITALEIQEMLNRPVISVVPEDDAVKRSMIERTPIVMLNPERRSARAFKNVAFNIGELGKLEAITVWERLLNKFIK